MPVIVTSPAEFDAWLTGDMETALTPQRPLPVEMLKAVAKDERKDENPGQA
jgi:putative SOS response-associated peptidase YedK